MEGVRPQREFLSLILSLLRENGYEELSRVVVPPGMGMPRVLLLTVEDTDVFDLEEFRSLAPDEDIRAAYSLRRNYAFPPDKARLPRLHHIKPIMSRSGAEFWRSAL